VDVVRYFNDKGERIAAILDTTFGERIAEPVPVVILPPATGRRKETLSGLALTITENFRRRGRHVAVLRFDGIRRHGESTNDPAARKPGFDMIHSSMGQAIADIQATLDFIHANERFRPSQVAIVSSSSASIEARRAVAEDRGGRIHYWISLAGSPDFHDTLKNICGGLDLLGSYRNGVPLGVVPVLGNPVDLDHFFEDAFARGLVYLRDAMDEIACIGTPITWIYGRFDDWVRPERVMNLMSVREGGPREVMSIPTGHQMRTSEEAIEAFKLVTACLWRFLYRRPIRPYAPDPRHVADVREAEKARLETARIGDHRDFWRQYLERKDRYLGFDIIRETEAYRGLMQTQLEMLDLREGDVLLDAGCGTGNFAAMLLEQPAGLIGPAARPSRITLTDYVKEALGTARAKLEALNGRSSPTRLEFETIDLEISRLGSVAEAIAGDRVAWDILGEGVEGMPPALARKLREHPDPLAEAVARGEDPGDAHAKELAARHGAEAAEILSDLGRAARFVRRALVAGDLRPPGAQAPSPEAHDRLDASAVRWKRLAFGRATLRFTLPFADASYDRILSSLVLCYLHRPEATIREFHRMLRPGGVLVISSMKPDADVSRIYMRLIERLRTATDVAIPAGLTREDLLTSARTFLNKAAGILNLEEEGVFEFVDRDRLVAMLEGAGFRDVRAVDRFGDPPQAYVLSGRRP
jgi:ubiquinone/menaquinone biosynthesis C-methylase UbiE